MWYVILHFIKIGIQFKMYPILTNLLSTANGSHRKVSESFQCLVPIM